MDRWENDGLRLKADSHTILLTLGQELPRCSLKVIAQNRHRITPSAKSRDETQRFPKLISSSSQLPLKFLFRNASNRTVDKGQPWRNPTCTENKLDLVQKMHADLALFLFWGGCG